MSLAKIFFTALPGINKHLLRSESIGDKLDYLYWLKKEMKNMIIEFNRIDAGWMYKISQEGFSSRNKNLDSFIKTGVKALTHNNELTKNNLYDYVNNQVKVREKIVIPQIDNEIEYYERIARTADNHSNNHKTKVQKFLTFDFDYRKIRVEIDELPTYGKKKAYLLFLQKELKRVIRCFENERYPQWENKSIDCTERDIFIKTRYRLFNEVYDTKKHNVDKYLEEDLKEKLEELKDLAKAIADEMEFVNAMSSISEERNMDDYKILWEELIEGNFDLKILLRQFEQIGEEKEDEYIEYCVRRFRHRTKDEWVRYYATKNLTENIEALKKANLPEELEYKNTIRITNARFEESTLGQWTKENLESFESKYITKNYLPTITNKIKKLRIEINKLIKSRLPIKAEIKNLRNELAHLETKFDNDIDEFPLNLKDELADCKEKLEKNEQALNNIDIQLWGTFDSKEEGLIWKHDRLVQDFKKQSIGKQEVFVELDYKSTGRWTEELKKKIIKILSRNGKEIDDDELDELVLEVIKKHQSDNEEVYNEILNPDLREVHQLKAINSVLTSKGIISAKGITENETIMVEKESINRGETNKDTEKNNENKNPKVLKSFGRGELQKEAEPLAIEYKLIAGESAKSTKVRLITKRLREAGWDANEPSVSEALRKMGYVKGRRK